ncbi:MAG: hypothetical protein IPM39_22390 [Chloroflexi bacterium]|nr:hypothetical protein [Chloroflexota bacterium]
MPSAVADTNPRHPPPRMKTERHLPDGDASKMLALRQSEIRNPKFLGEEVTK